MSVYTNDAITSPVTATELAEYLRLDDATDPVLAGILLAATDAVTNYIGRNLINRDYTLLYWDWPAEGTLESPSLTKHRTGVFRREFDLPFANLVSVTAVEVYGTAFADFITRYDSVVFDQYFTQEADQTNDNPAVKITYTAGYGATAADVPGQIKEAVKMVAAYLFTHRGGCDFGMAIKESGAACLLYGYKKVGVIL